MRTNVVVFVMPCSVALRYGFSAMQIEKSTPIVVAVVVGIVIVRVVGFALFGVV